MITETRPAVKAMFVKEGTGPGYGGGVTAQGHAGGGVGEY